MRRDLRLGDNAALSAATEGGPVIALFIRDGQMDGLGAAPKWRLGEGLRVLEDALEVRGSRLILRTGAALDVLRAVIAETGAGAVHWRRLYDPLSRERDGEIKSALRSDGIMAQSHGGHLLHEPWSVETGTGGFYKVYTPFWKAVRGRDPGASLPEPRIAVPGGWPSSEKLDEWALGMAMRRGAQVVARHCRPGEAAAEARLTEFIEVDLAGYRDGRDMVAQGGTSGLSDYLALGEIAPTDMVRGDGGTGGGQSGGGSFPAADRVARFCPSPDLSHAAYSERQLARRLGSVPVVRRCSAPAFPGLETGAHGN